MKHNFKTLKEKLVLDVEKVINDNQDYVWDSLLDVWAELEGFEKELRRKMEVLNENFPSWDKAKFDLVSCARGAIIEIKEVLGES